MPRGGEAHLHPAPSVVSVWVRQPAGGGGTDTRPTPPTLGRDANTRVCARPPPPLPLLPGGQHLYQHWLEESGARPPHPPPRPRPRSCPWCSFAVRTRSSSLWVCAPRSLTLCADADQPTLWQLFFCSPPPPPSTRPPPPPRPTRVAPPYPSPRMHGSRPCRPAGRPPSASPPRLAPPPLPPPPPPLPRCRPPLALTTVPPPPGRRPTPNPPARGASTRRAALPRRRARRASPTPPPPTPPPSRALTTITPTTYPAGAATPWSTACAAPACAT